MNSGRSCVVGGGLRGNGAEPSPSGPPSATPPPPGECMLPEDTGLDSGKSSLPPSPTDRIFVMTRTQSPGKNYFYYSRPTMIYRLPPPFLHPRTIRRTKPEERGPPSIRFFFIGHAHTFRLIATGLFLIFENDGIVLFSFSRRPTTTTEFLSPLIRPRSAGETLAQRLGTMRAVYGTKRKQKSSRITFRSRFFFCRPHYCCDRATTSDFPDTPFCIFYNIRFTVIGKCAKTRDAMNGTDDLRVRGSRSNDRKRTRRTRNRSKSKANNSSRHTAQRLLQRFCMDTQEKIRVRNSRERAKHFDKDV